MRISEYPFDGNGLVPAKITLVKLMISESLARRAVWENRNPARVIRREWSALWVAPLSTGRRPCALLQCSRCRPWSPSLYRDSLHASRDAQTPDAHKPDGERHTLGWTVSRAPLYVSSGMAYSNPYPSLWGTDNLLSLFTLAPVTRQVAVHTPAGLFDVHVAFVQQGHGYTAMASHRMGSLRSGKSVVWFGGFHWARRQSQDIPGAAGRQLTRVEGQWRLHTSSKFYIAATHPWLRVIRGRLWIWPPCCSPARWLKGFDPQWTASHDPPVVMCVCCSNPPPVWGSLQQADATGVQVLIIILIIIQKTQNTQKED